MSSSNRGTAIVAWIAVVLAGAALAVGIAVFVQQGESGVAAQQAREALEQANQKIAVLETACRAAASQETVTASLAQIRAEVASMNSALSAYKGALDALVKQSEDLAASISAASDGIKVCSTDADGARQQIAAVKGDVDKLAERFGDLGRQTRMLKTQVLLARESPVSTSSGTAVVDLTAQTENEAVQVAEATSAAQSLTEELSGLARRVESFSGKLSALEKLQGQLAGKLKSLRDENAEFLEGVFYNVLWKEAGVDPAEGN